jgi:hypothetical protein
MLATESDERIPGAASAAIGGTLPGSHVASVVEGASLAITRASRGRRPLLRLAYQRTAGDSLAGPVARLACHPAAKAGSEAPRRSLGTPRVTLTARRPLFRLACQRTAEAPLAGPVARLAYHPAAEPRFEAARRSLGTPGATLTAEEEPSA